jgi:hypothetical protein
LGEPTRRDHGSAGTRGQVGDRHFRQQKSEEEQHWPSQRIHSWLTPVPPPRSACLPRGTVAIRLVPSTSEGSELSDYRMR